MQAVGKGPATAVWLSLLGDASLKGAGRRAGMDVLGRVRNMQSTFSSLRPPGFSSTSLTGEIHILLVEDCRVFDSFVGDSSLEFQPVERPPESVHLRALEATAMIRKVTLYSV